MLRTSPEGQMPSWINAPTEQYRPVQTDQSDVVALPHFENPASGEPINPQFRRGSAFPSAGERPMHVGDVPVELNFDYPQAAQRPHVNVEYLPRRPLTGIVRPQFLLSDGRPEQARPAQSQPLHTEASTSAAVEAAPKPTARELNRVMSGPYREMIISGREPRVRRGLVEKLYGLKGDLMASLHLPYRVPPIDRSAKDQPAARRQASRETRPRAHANELVVLDVSTGGTGGKAQYMVTTRAFLGKLEKTPRIFRGWRMRRNQDEVRVLGPDESLQIGRGEAASGETPRWIPDAILAQEKTAHDQVLGDNQGTFRVSSNGVLSYESTGQADDETMEASTLPQEDAYDATTTAFEAAARMFKSGDNTMTEVEAAKGARLRAANALPAGPERIDLPQRTVSAASILARLAAERSLEQPAATRTRVPQMRAAQQPVPVIPGRPFIPAQRSASEPIGESRLQDETEEFDKVNS